MEESAKEGKRRQNKVLFVNNKITRKGPGEETINTQSGVERGHFVDGEIPMHKNYALRLYLILY